jgi:hypothetical protein
MKVSRARDDHGANVQVSEMGAAEDDLGTRSTVPSVGPDETQPATPRLETVTGREDAGAGFLVVPGPDSPVWDACPWLDDLRDVPSSASWPRLMTLPHPAAVGSYGAEVDAQFRRRTGTELRWWQRLANARILEHDARGRLVWTKWLETTARQVGKSTDLRELLWWRIHQTDRWGEQLALHTGKDLGIVGEVMTPAMVLAERLGYAVNWSTAREEIERHQDVPPPACSTCGGEPFLTPLPASLCPACHGSQLEPGIPPGQLRGRWISRSVRAVYGWSPGFGVVDEAWKVPPRAVDDGIWPTLTEQESPQLGLLSTAHPEATGLVLVEREMAVAQLFDPHATLLLEWSTPRHFALDDERGWRMASPHWSQQRRTMIAGALRKALNGSADPEDPDPVGSFRCQWLNQWPQDVEPATNPDDLLATEDEWAACLDAAAEPAPGRPVVVAVEDDRGRGAAAAAAALTADGRVVVGGYRFGTLREAVDWCEDTAGEDGLMLAGASLVPTRDQPGDPELEGVDLPLEPAGGVETRDGLPTLRALVRGGRLAHDGGQDVSSAVLAAKVRTSKAGVLLVDPDVLLRCVVWVARRAHRDRD